MNTAKRIFKNTSILFIAQVVNYILAFFYTIYLARYLGVSGFGVLTFGISFTTIMGVTADLGLSILAVREIARDKSISSGYTGNLIVIKLVLSSITMGLIVLFMNLFNCPSQTIQVVYLLALWMLFTSFTQLFYSVFQAYEEIEYQSIGTILYSILLFSGVFYGIFNNFSIEWFALIYLIVSGVILTYTVFIQITRFPRPSLQVNWNFWKSKLTLALPLSIALIFSTIAFRVDTVLLSLFQGYLVVGLYTAPYKIIEVLLFIPSVYSAVIFPVLSRFHVSSKESFQLIYVKSIKYMIILGLPIAAGITILSKDIILILYQSAFSGSVVALQILIWTVPLLLLTTSFGIILISMNKQVLAIRLTFIYMIFNIGVNLVVIPYFSYLGAAVVTVLTELVNFIMLFYYLSKFICKVPLHRLIWKPALATVIMSLFMISVHLNIFITVLLATIIYFALLILFKTFSKGDYNIIRKLVEKG
ncbi:flippase [Methanobacterium sp.]|uniref:flippase n=1 Tax=Methanobacterium sp. TaxID=2164 RepID=UPI0031594520